MNRHWRINEDKNRIAWLHFDLQQSPVNLLTPEALEELDACIEALTRLAPAGVILISDKASGFIAGADVRGFMGLKDPMIVERYVERAQSIFSALERLPMPTVALIDGFCLGGGLELALACRYRVVSDDPATRIGFPEVRLGIFPGFGGTARSTGLLGPRASMDLMLSGRNIDGRTAKRLGLADLLVPRRQLIAAARRLIEEQPAIARPPWWNRFLSSTPLRALLAALMQRQVAKRTRQEHYPAPFVLIDHWRRNGGDPQRMYRGEASAVSRLITGPMAQNLIRVFLLQERLKSLGRDAAFEPIHVHVIGGGIMGGDIAAWCALKGLRVTLQDQAPERLKGAIARAHELFTRKLRLPHLIRAADDRLMPDCQGDGIARADLVVEAIYEEVAAKRTLYQAIESWLKPGALLATNTSSIPLERLTPGLSQPQRLVGLHFFNPVARMQLVEVVKGRETGDAEFSRAMAFVHQIERLPLPVKSTPGFLVNRVLMPYLMEAIVLLGEGVTPEQVDQSAIQFGMPMGPVELADRVGLDISLSVAEKLARQLGCQIPESLRDHVARGELGRKSGQGYYRYDRGRPVKARVRLSATRLEELATRLIERLLTEAVACLRDGVVADSDLLDAGIVFGTGFAPFRGGPMQYIRENGREGIRQRLRQLESDPNRRFPAHTEREAAA